MTETLPNTDRRPTWTPRRGGRRRRWAWVVLALVALLLLAYHAAFSEAALRHWLVPRIAASLETEIELGSIEVHPFSRITLHDLVLRQPDHPPFLASDRVEVRYRWLPWLQGRTVIEELRLTGLVLLWQTSSNGISNFETLEESPAVKSWREKRRRRGNEDPASAVELQEVAVQDATLLRVKEGADGTVQRQTVRNLNLTLSGLKNQGSARLDLSALWEAEDGRGGEMGFLHGRTMSIRGKSDLFCDENLVPVSWQGGLTAELRPRDSLAATGNPALHEWQLDFDLEGNVETDQWRFEVSPLVWLRRGTSVLQGAMSGRWETNRLVLEQTQWRLPGSERGSNTVMVAGWMDWISASGIAGKLKVSTSALDLDLWESSLGRLSAPVGEASVADADGEASGRRPRVEPSPMSWPFDDFQVSLTVPKAYWRQLELDDVEWASTLEGSVFRVEKLKARLDEGEVLGQLTLDTGKRGWLYECRLQANELPLAPFMGSFSPLGSRGQMSGRLIMDTHWLGQGWTDTNLRDHLQGHCDVRLTNMVARLAGASGLDGQAWSGMDDGAALNSAGGLMQALANVLRLPDLRRAPLHWVDLQMGVRGGALHLDSLWAQTEAYRIGVAGLIPLGVPLDESPIPGLPLQFALERSVAHQVNLLPASAPGDAAYVSLPEFVSLAGTLGEPKADFKKAVLTGLMLKSAAGLSGTFTRGAGSLLHGFGEWLTGERHKAARAERGRQGGATGPDAVQ